MLGVVYGKDEKENINKQRLWQVKSSKILVLLPILLDASKSIPGLITPTTRSLFLTLTPLLPALLCFALHSTPRQLQALLLLVSASPAGSAAQPPPPPPLPEPPSPPTLFPSPRPPDPDQPHRAAAMHSSRYPTQPSMFLLSLSLTEPNATLIRGKSIGAPTTNPNQEIERSYCGARREEEIERGTYGAGASEEARGDRAWWRRTAPSTGVRQPRKNPNRGGGIGGGDRLLE